MALLANYFTLQSMLHLRHKALRATVVMVGLAAVLCGYPAPLVAGPEEPAALLELCGLHTAVTGLAPSA